MHDDEPDEEEPPGLVYDNRAPCHLPDFEPNPGFSVDGNGRALNLSGGPMVLNPEPDDVGYCIPPAELEPKPTSVPFAEGGERPRWPLLTDAEDLVRVSYQDVRNLWHGKWGRHFGTGRKSGDERRHHVGVDLSANEGDTVVAMEDGEILGILPFHHGSYAIYIKNDSGDILNYGEVKKNSWWQYGIKSGIGTGQRVKAGQRLADIGVMKKDSMLHLETYRHDTTMREIRDGQMKWQRDQEPPPKILDPTRYLVRAQRDWFDKKAELT